MPKVYISFSVNAAFIDVEVTHAIGNNTPSYHSHELAGNNLDGLFLLLPFFETTTFIIFKNNLKD